MQKAKQIIRFLTGCVLAIGLDQWTKSLAVDKLKGQPPLEIIQGVFELWYSENRGAAFGMLQGRQFFFFLIGIIVIAAAAYLLYRMPCEKKYLPLGICLFLITAGAIGNMIDRISQGFVVDFLYFKLIDFPIFNVADIYVTVSAVLLVILVMFFYHDEDFIVFSLKKGKRTKI